MTVTGARPSAVTVVVLVIVYVSASGAAEGRCTVSVEENVCFTVVNVVDVGEVDDVDVDVDVGEANVVDARVVRMVDTRDASLSTPAVACVCRFTTAEGTSVVTAMTESWFDAAPLTLTMLYGNAVEVGHPQLAYSVIHTVYVSCGLSKMSLFCKEPVSAFSGLATKDRASSAAMLHSAPNMFDREYRMMKECAYRSGNECLRKNVSC